MYVTVTVNIDAEAWETNYGVSGAKEVREVVKAYATNLVTEHLREVGVLKEEN